MIAVDCPIAVWYQRIIKIEFYRDLESYHAWAMGRVLTQCKSFDSDALTATLPLGPGSLLATLKHMAAAEQVWLDRWLLKPNPSLHDMPNSIEELESVFASLARDRATLLESDPNALSKSIPYRNMKGEPDEQKLGDLVLHVLNHGIHHRAQVAHFLKRQGIHGTLHRAQVNNMLRSSGKTPEALDFIVWLRQTNGMNRIKPTA